MFPGGRKILDITILGRTGFIIWLILLIVLIVYQLIRKDLELNRKVFVVLLVITK